MKDRMKNFINIQLMVVVWSFFGLIVLFVVFFPQNNGGKVTGKQVDKGSGSPVFVVPHCSIRLHPLLKHLSGSCSTVSHIMGAGKS